MSSFGFVGHKVCARCNTLGTLCEVQCCALDCRKLQRCSASTTTSAVHNSNMIECNVPSSRHLMCVGASNDTSLASELRCPPATCTRLLLSLTHRYSFAVPKFNSVQLNDSGSSSNNNNVVVVVAATTSATTMAATHWVPSKPFQGFTTNIFVRGYNARCQLQNSNFL